MRRRDFIKVMPGPAVVWPLAARAQQRALPTIGLLSSRSPAVDAPLIALIRQGLNETGFVEGQNVAIDYRWAEGQYDRLAKLAADLARQQVAVIVQSYSRLAATRSELASSTTCIVLVAISQG
jgi:putative ABC transport system substrate-binding protein